jgi:hypothetical protein
VTRTNTSPPTTDDRSQVTERDTPGRPSAATVRKALIQALAAIEPATAKALEDGVGALLPAAERPSVRQQLQVLREGKYVIEAPDDHRRVILSDSGRRWWAGIKALAPFHS